MNAKQPSSDDLVTLSLQLGRPVRDVVGIPARCACGSPIVATTAPRLSNGIPFPTTFYLTHPAATAAVSRVEASGEMARMNERLHEDSELGLAYRAAHDDYLRRREDVRRRAGLDPVWEIEGISAGGMPERVKCLHVLAGHALAAGPGVNPLGDEVLTLIASEFSPQRCVCASSWDHQAEVPEKDLSRHVRRKNQGYAAEAAEAPPHFEETP